MKKSNTGTPSGTARRRISIERTFKAPLEDVWDLWTTKEGIESWWGPEGFAVTVQKLDLRPGGELRYAMTAIAPEQAAFMKKSGMPLTTEARITFTEVKPRRHLAYTHDVDFVPGVESYGVDTDVELQESPQGVRMLLTFDAMHEALWTQRQTAGWESQLGKLEKLIDNKKKDSHMQKITPFLWFNDNAEEAARFYVSVFNNSKLTNVSPGPGGKAMSVTFQLEGLGFMALNGGPHFKFTEAISLFVDCETQEEVDTLWSKLIADGGEPSRCGWLKDKFGLSWQIIPASLGKLLRDNDPAKAKRVMEAMLKMSKIDIQALRDAHDGTKA